MSEKAKAKTKRKRFAKKFLKSSIKQSLIPASLIPVYCICLLAGAMPWGGARWGYFGGARWGLLWLLAFEQEEQHDEQQSRKKPAGEEFL
jgi:hypothetical protein